MNDEIPPGRPPAPDESGAPRPAASSAPPYAVASPWAAPGGGAAVPPPPPPPPPPPSAYTYGTPMWQPATTWQVAPPVRSRSRRVIAGGLGLIFAAGIGAGVVTGRLTASPTPSDATAVAPSDTSSSAPGGAGSGSGSAGGGSVDTAAVAAKVTPGIVNVNITLAGGSAAGTGMVITSTGQVLTNNHVIDGETSLTVQFPSTGRKYTAQVMGYDVADDVALLQIQGGGTFTTVDIGNSSAVTVGQTVVALGNAQGRNTLPAVTSGSVTALNQAVTATDQSGGSGEHITGLIEVDAPIQPGDSGGPLTNSSGTVLGMDTAAQVSSTRFNQQPSTTAYAIPINHAIAVVKQIQSGKSTRTIHVGDTRPLIGIGVVDSSKGVQVNTVQPGSAAANAGIAIGAIVTAVDGTRIDTNATLRGVLVAHNPGDSVSVTWTDAAGATHTATVTLGSGPPA